MERRHYTHTHTPSLLRLDHVSVAVLLAVRFFCDCGFLRHFNFVFKLFFGLSAAHHWLVAVVNCFSKVGNLALFFRSVNLAVVVGDRLKMSHTMSTIGWRWAVILISEMMLLLV